MAKFKVPSWLQSQHSTSAATCDTERKKHHRRSFAGFPQSRATRDRETVNSTDTSGLAHQDGPLVKDDSKSRMTSLSITIANETQKLETFLHENNLSQPGLEVTDAGDFPKLPLEMQECRQKIIQATQELTTLVQGPRESIRWGVWRFLDTLSLQIINYYGIAKLVPVQGGIELADLQALTPLDPINLSRILRHAMTNHIFQESSPGFIAHSAASRLLAEDDALRDWVGFNSEDIFPAAANVLTSLQTYPEATSLTRTGFNFAFNTVDQEPMFVTFGKDPDRARRMGGAMASLTGGEGYEVHHFVDNYDLSAIDNNNGIFVDIGGSHGFVCVALAKKWTNMKFIVQDLPRTIGSIPQPICDNEQAARRIQAQAHDFFLEQPVKDADVYFFRWIIHNYSTPLAIKILQNLIPALKPGARIVINDHCLRQPGSETPWDEKLMRSMDLVMLTLLNAQERHEDEFRDLFAQADPRFQFKGVKRTKGCRMSVIEAVWNPEIRSEVTS